MKLVDDNLAGIRQDFSGGEALPVIALMTEWQKEGAGFSVTEFCIVLFTKHMAISRASSPERLIWRVAIRET